MNIQAGASRTEDGARIGNQNICDGIGRGDFHVVGIIIAKDLQGIQPLLSQIDRPPLRQPPAGSGGAVAEGSKVRDIVPLPADILMEDLIHNPADRIIDRSAVDEVLVVRGTVRDIEGISLTPVPFGEHPV